MKRRLLLAALLLPVLGLGASIWRGQEALGQAELWRIPITGHDPRDPLRGRFITFAYAWDVQGSADACNSPRGCQLCLEQAGDSVRAIVTAQGASCPGRVDLRLSRITTRQPFRDAEAPSFTSRIFVSETSAPMLEQQLRDGPMVVIAARTADGRLVNRRIEPAR